MKKKYISRIIVLTLTFSLGVLILSGCGRGDSNKNPDSTAQSSESDMNTNSESDESDKNTTSNSSAKDDKDATKATDSHDIYTLSIINLLENGFLPDGSKANFDDETLSKLDSNHYAVSDINCDGTDELILSMTETVTANQCMYIYALDSEDSFKKIASSSPIDAKFYENGTYTVKWVNSTGKHDEEHWPIDIYTFNKETNKFEVYGSVETWQKSIAPVDPTSQEPFPDEFDTDGNDILYKIGYGDNFAAPYCSQSELDSFYDEILGDSNELSITWIELCQD